MLKGTETIFDLLKTKEEAKMKITMSKKIKKVTLLLYIAALSTTQVYAQTNVSGFINSNTTWTIAGSPYIVIGNIVLDSGITLTIDPGVIVEFDSAKSLQIEGNLRAIGNNSNRITFTSSQVAPAPGDWDYILFSDNSQDYDYSLFTGSIMEHCIVEYAGASLTTNTNGAIRIRRSFPYIHECEVRNNASTGIQFYEGPLIGTIGTIRISNCNIHDNSSFTDFNPRGGGIGIWSSQTQVIVDNNIINNNYGNGIHCIANNISQITNNTIIRNSVNGWGGGIFMVSIGNISFNLIYGNSAIEGSGIYRYNLSNCCPDAITISNNVIVNNNSTNNDAVYAESLIMTKNTIVDNTSDVSNLTVVGWSTNTLINNTITRNKLIGSSSTRAVYIKSPTVFKNNNIYLNDADYELYTDVNQSIPNINAESCWWNTSSGTDIDTMVYDFLDDGTLTIVDYNPFATLPDTMAPVTPPFNVIKTDLGGGNIRITWNANIEADLAGYKIYWGSPSGYSFANSVDVGNVTTYTLTGLLITDTIAVTAYDNLKDGIKDQFDGNESWYTNAIGIPIASISASSVIICPGDTVLFTGNGVDIDNWSWTFSGGNPSTSGIQNPLVIYPSSGTDTATLIAVNIAGSDTVTQLITVNPSYNQNDSAAICNGDIYTFPDGDTSTIAITDTSILSTVAGCDSIIITTLIINPNYNTPETAAICSGDSIFLQGNYQTVAGTYYDTLATVNGCDSVIATMLIINPTYSTPDTAAICSGDSIFLQGKYQTAAGTYYDTLATVKGCDSVIATMLSINPNYNTPDTAEICSGDSIFLQDNYQTAAGTYYDSLATVKGCDSVIATTLNINPLPFVALVLVEDSVCENAGAFTLGGSPSGGTYSGVGVNGGNFDPSLAGIGTHTITYTYQDGNNCTDSATATIYVDVCSGIQTATSNRQSIVIYPNPTSGKVIVAGYSRGLIEIYNVFGTKVYQSEISNSKSEINLNLPGGMYFYQVSNQRQLIGNGKFIIR